MITTMLRLRNRNYWLGLPTICLTTVISLSSCVHKTTGIEGEENKFNEVLIGDEVNVSHYYVYSEDLKDTKLIDIKGSWDDSLAIKLMENILKNNESSPISPFMSPCTHEVIGLFNVEVHEKKKVIGVCASNDGGCVACSVSLSFFEFVKYPPGWIMERNWLFQVETGDYGEPPDKINLFMIGEDKYGIFTEDFATTQGYHTEITEIFSLVGDNFKEVFNYCTFYEDSSIGEDAFGSWFSSIEIIKEGSNYFDLLVKTDGSIDMEKLSDVNIFQIDEDTELPEEVLYKFNGIKYVESGIYD